jgi:hypothetical protein
MKIAENKFLHLKARNMLPHLQWQVDGDELQIHMHLHCDYVSGFVK